MLDAMTVDLIDLGDNSEPPQRLTLRAFFEANEDGFSPVETFDLIKDLLESGRARIDGALGMRFDLVRVN